jgi:hypothetical protein
MNGNHVDEGREQEDGKQRQVQDMPQAKQALVEHEGGAVLLTACARSSHADAAGATTIQAAWPPRRHVVRPPGRAGP